MHRLLLVSLLCAIARCWANVDGSTVDIADVSSFHQQEELLQGLRVLYPQPNSQYKSPLAFRFQLLTSGTPDYSALMDLYAGRRWLCLQLDGTWRRCIAIESGTLIAESIDPGNHTARLAAFDAPTPETGVQLMQSDEVAFTILSDEDFAAALKQQRFDDLALYESGNGEEENESAVEWFRARRNKAEEKRATNHVTREVDAATGQVKPLGGAKPHGSPTKPPLLVIGVKTRVIDGFPFRQAIRQTWASKDSLPHNVRVFFAGCRVPADVDDEVRQAIAYEQKAYRGDLLTDVLDCEDSYATLPQKVKEFLHFVGTDHVLRRAGYVMIADEDVYLRVEAFTEQIAALGPLHNLYAGHVKEGNSFLPERDPQRRYYLPESVYPLDEFPPFAWGPHYIMSMDVVEFIADNREELQGLGALDDVTIALWLLAIQVHPQHLDSFQNLRECPCENELLAYADLGPPAIRIIHSNLNSGRSFCHGFNAHSWDKDSK